MGPSLKQNPTIHKNNLKIDKDLKVRPETIKLLNDNTESTLLDINHSKILCNPPPRIIKTETRKLDLVKLKIFCIVKETITNIKRKPSECEKNNSKRIN